MNKFQIEKYYHQLLAANKNSCCLFNELDSTRLEEEREKAEAIEREEKEEKEEKPEKSGENSGNETNGKEEGSTVKVEVKEEVKEDPPIVEKASEEGEDKPAEVKKEDDKVEEKEEKKVKEEEEKEVTKEVSKEASKETKEEETTIDVKPIVEVKVEEDKVADVIVKEESTEAPIAETSKDLVQSEEAKTPMKPEKSSKDKLKLLEDSKDLNSPLKTELENVSSECELEESESDLDAKLSIDEIRMKMTQLNNMNERLNKQMQSNLKIIRSSCLGQDRWRRRLWNLPNSGGVFVEGGFTSEFEELNELVQQKIKQDEENKKLKEVEETSVEEEMTPVTEPVITPAPTPTPESADNKIDDENSKLENGHVDSQEKDLDKKLNGELFDVAPPVIKIFSFSPRVACSGKTKELEVKKEVKLEPTDDEMLIQKIVPELWNVWRKIDESDLENYTEALCSQGIREKNLKNNLAGIAVSTEVEELDDDEIPLNVKSPLCGWDPDLKYKVHLQMLETMETLEERVASASLQVKGWQLPSRHPSAANCTLSEREILEVVKIRLLDLESAIERRYLKLPLGKSAHELNLSNLGGENDNSNSSNNGNQSQQGSRALTHWRDGVQRGETPGVLSMAMYTLDSSIAWDKSVMKASCQLCKGGDNEDKLLLCDACDRGYHTYCFKPPLEQIPDGDWFCWECINKATGVKGCIVCGKQGHGKILACDKCVKAYHIDCLSPPLNKAPRGRWHCPDHRKLSPSRKRKSVASTSKEGESSSEGTAKETTKKEKPPNKKQKSEISWCEKILDELSTHEDAWPFLEPVNTRQFPTYKKVIKNPMDLLTIRGRLNTYKSREGFLGDVRLIFDNCETFNEDDSPVGKAGHSLRLFFEAKTNK